MRILSFLLPLYLTAQTPDQVYNLAAKIGIKHPEIVVCQSINECGWKYESYSAKNRNNLFGFRYNGEYLSFNSWEESVYYYKKWQTKYYSGGENKQNRYEYYSFLKCIYSSKSGCHSYSENPEQYIVELEQILFRWSSC